MREGQFQAEAWDESPIMPGLGRTREYLLSWKLSIKQLIDLLEPRIDEAEVVRIYINFRNRSNLKLEKISHLLRINNPKDISAISIELFYSDKSTLKFIPVRPWLPGYYEFDSAPNYDHEGNPTQEAPTKSRIQGVILRKNLSKISSGIASWSYRAFIALILCSILIGIFFIISILVLLIFESETFGIFLFAMSFFVLYIYILFIVSGRFQKVPPMENLLGLNLYKEKELITKSRSFRFRNAIRSVVAMVVPAILAGLAAYFLPKYFDRFF